MLSRKRRSRLSVRKDRRIHDRYISRIIDSLHLESAIQILARGKYALISLASCAYYHLRGLPCRCKSMIRSPVPSRRHSISSVRCLCSHIKAAAATAVFSRAVYCRFRHAAGRNLPGAAAGRIPQIIFCCVKLLPLEHRPWPDQGVPFYQGVRYLTHRREYLLRLFLRSKHLQASRCRHLYINAQPVRYKTYPCLLYTSSYCRSFLLPILL